MRVAYHIREDPADVDALLTASTRSEARLFDRSVERFCGNGAKCEEDEEQDHPAEKRQRPGELAESSSLYRGRVNGVPNIRQGCLVLAHPSMLFARSRLAFQAKVVC